VETGVGGSKEDVNAIASHFRVLIRYIVNDRIDFLRAGSYYGGRLNYWSQNFRSLADNSSPAAKSFSEKERASFGLLADALNEIIPTIETAQREDALTKVMREPSAKLSAEPPRVILSLSFLLILAVSVGLAFMLIRRILRRSGG
jgi:hypothetical protein